MPKRPAPSPEAREGNAPRKRQCSPDSATNDTDRRVEDASSGSRIAGPGIIIPSLSDITPWKASEIPSRIPSLPKILDAKLEQTVFTHPGLGLEQNYERLEWLGDAYLELIASSLIYQTFRHTPSGRCSQLRETLIRNVTLAQYFRQYNLHLRAKLPAELSHGGELGRGRSSDKDRLKTQADMFEAYVAAIIVSDPKDGLATVIGWLKGLWAGTLSRQIIDNERSLSGSGQTRDQTAPSPAKGGVDTQAKEELRAAIGVKGVVLRYEDMPGNSKHREFGLPLFTVGVFLDGWGETNKMLGIGTALQKKEAGHKAARAALNNKKLMKVYRSKKEAFQKAVADAATASTGMDAVDNSGTVG